MWFIKSFVNCLFICFFFRELIKWESKSKGKKPTNYSVVNFYSLKVQCPKHLRLVGLTAFLFPKVKFGLSDYRQRATCHNPNARIFSLPQDRHDSISKRTWLFLLGTAIGGYTDVA